MTADVAVIGAGVVGCAIARRFTLEGARVILLERGADICFRAPAKQIAPYCTRASTRRPDSVELALHAVRLCRISRHP